MQYYMLGLPNYTGKKRFLGDVYSIGKYSPWDLWTSQEICDWSNTFFVQSSKTGNDGPPDDIVLNTFSVFIISEKLRDAIIKNSIKGIRFLPIQLRLSSSRKYDGFYVANILNEFPLDIKKAQFKARKERDGTEEVTSIRRVAVCGGTSDSLHLFRVKEYNTCVFASHFFKTIYEKINCTGVSFMRRS